MKIIVLKNNILEAFSSVERAARDGVNLPILKSVHIKTENNKIITTGTNLELAISHSFSGKIIEQGEIVVPFSPLYAVIKNLNSERINLELKNKKLFVTTENYEASFQVQDPSEFPIIPSIKEGDEYIETTAKQLAEILSNVAPATQHSEIRPEISGVFVYSADNGDVVFVATDGFRLSEQKTTQAQITSSFKNESLNIIVPLRTADEMLKILSSRDESEQVRIFTDQTQILFKTNSVQAVSRLVDGTFPEYQPIIPKQTKIEIAVPRDEFLQATKLTSSFSGKGNDVKISTGEGKKYIEVSSSDNTIGENTYKIPAKLKGEEFTILLNWRFLSDGLKILKGDNVILGINSSDKPILLKDPKNPFLSYTIMPIKG